MHIKHHVFVFSACNGVDAVRDNGRGDLEIELLTGRVIRIAQLDISLVGSAVAVEAKHIIEVDSRANGKGAVRALLCNPLLSLGAVGRIKLDIRPIGRDAAAYIKRKPGILVNERKIAIRVLGDDPSLSA